MKNLGGRSSLNPLSLVPAQITDLDSGVQQWAKLLKNIRGDFKDLEKKKKKKKPEEHQKKMIKVGKDVAKVVKHIKSIVTKVKMRSEFGT